MRKLFFISIGLFCLMVACKSRKQQKSLTSKVQSEKLETEALVSMVAARNTLPEYLSFKSKGSFKDGQNQQSFTLHIRMRKDSLMWVSVTAFGLEAARALIKHDSIYLIDRINKKYFVYDYGFLSQLVKMPVNMHQVQSLLCAQLLFTARDYRYHLNEDKHWQLLHTDTYQEERVHLNELLKPTERSWSQLADMRSLQSSYENFQAYELHLLPQTAVYKMQSGNRLSTLTLNHSQINVEKIQQYPFTIPSSYQKGN